MPVRPVSVTFFFTVHSFYEYVQSIQLNSRNGKKIRNKSKLFYSMLFSFSPRICIWSTNKETMIALCLKQYCDPWAAKTLGCFSASFDENATPKRWKTFFFGQQMLLAENVVKGPAQYKFGLAYWYHLFLVTKNIIKVYKEDVYDFIRFFQIYLCLLCVYFFFFDNLWKDSVVFSF